MTIKEGGAGRKAFQAFNYSFLFLLMLIAFFILLSLAIG